MSMLTTTPRFAAGTPGRTLGRTIAIILARIGRFVNRCIAAEIARRERQGALAALSMLDERHLKDIGICRSEIRDALSATAATRSRMRRSL